MPRSYRGSNSAVSKRLMEKDRGIGVKEEAVEEEETEETPEEDKPNLEFKFTPKNDGSDGDPENSQEPGEENEGE